MFPFLAMLAGVLANQMQQSSAEKTMKHQQHRQMALERIHELDPSYPMYGAQAQMNREQLAAMKDQGRMQLFGQVLPMAVEGAGQLMSEPPPDPMQHLTNQWDTQANAGMFRDMNASRGGLRF